MESNSLRSSSPPEERRIVNRTINGEANNTNMKAIHEMKPQSKASCKHNSSGGGGGDEEEEEEEEEAESGFPRPPPRAYTCGFCKRQFRSAQALGGHMNVHRRDRAKLRRSPPMDHHFQQRNNPKPIIPSSCSSASTDQMKKWGSTHLHGFSSGPIKFLKLADFSSFNGEESDGGGKIWKKVKKFARMEETSLLGSSNDIDLELRLGF